MREFVLYVSLYNAEPCEWGIYQKDYDLWGHRDYSDKANKPYGFANFCIKDGEFMGCFDIFLNDEKTQATQNEDMFDEVCEFTVIIGENESKDKKSMSIKEAFKFIRSQFKGL